MSVHAQRDRYVVHGSVSPVSARDITARLLPDRRRGDQAGSTARLISIPAQSRVVFLRSDVGFQKETTRSFWNLLRNPTRESLQRTRRRSPTDDALEVHDESRLRKAAHAQGNCSGRLETRDLPNCCPYRVLAVQGGRAECRHSRVTRQLSPESSP